jgi:hypothetical protein
LANYKELTRSRQLHITINNREALLFLKFWKQKRFFWGGSLLKIDVQPFGKLIQSFIPSLFVIGFYYLALDVSEGAGSGEEEGGDGSDLGER